MKRKQHWSTCNGENPTGEYVYGLFGINRSTDFEHGFLACTSSMALSMTFEVLCIWSMAFSATCMTSMRWCMVLWIGTYFEYGLVQHVVWVVYLVHHYQLPLPTALCDVVQVGGRCERVHGEQLPTLFAPSPRPTAGRVEATHNTTHTSHIHTSQGSMSLFVSFFKTTNSNCTPIIFRPHLSYKRGRVRPPCMHLNERWKKLQCWFKLTGQNEQMLKLQTHFLQFELELDK